MQDELWPERSPLRAGVAVIAIGAATATALAGWRAMQRARDVYRPFRQQLRRSILLGLELLVAGDITRTVAVGPSIVSATALAIIVLIRTFLSFTLELEISGRWPWQQKADPPP